MSSVTAAPGRVAVLRSELGKASAFFRRDLLVMLSYRTAFVTDWVALVVQIVTFYYVGRMVDPATLPAYGGDRASYLEFVAIGIAITAFMQVALGRVVVAIRNEQLMGTLESLVLTPTSPATLQLGFVVYDLVYVPVRTFAFLGTIRLLFDVHFDLGGFLPALAMLLALIPFVWGLGVLSAAGVLTFRRGSGLTGFGTVILSLTSGAYFPISLFPDWVQTVAELNPLTIALRATRQVLLGDAGWADVAPDLLTLVPLAILSLAVGVGAWRLALRRERRTGTLGLY